MIQAETAEATYLYPPAIRKCMRHLTHYRADSQFYVFDSELGMDSGKLFDEFGAGHVLRRDWLGDVGRDYRVARCMFVLNGETF